MSSYSGKTSTRSAFENIIINPNGKWSATEKNIFRSLRRKSGTYKTKGWSLTKSADVNHYRRAKLCRL